MTLIFTVLMMFFMPPGIERIGMNQILRTARIGGTFDYTGGAAAAGSMPGPETENVAAVVKMIQNVFPKFVIGFVAASLLFSFVVPRRPMAISTPWNQSTRIP